MKSFFRLTAVAALVLLTSGCQNSSGATWENMKTAGRYIQRGVDAALGKDYESRMLADDDEFIGPYDAEFIPLSEGDLKNTVASNDMALPQPRGIPGQKGVPALDQYYNPSAELKALFQTVHFDTDEHVLRNKDELQAVQKLAAYLKQNPSVYLAIFGHCDERASASYNISLGMRRANYIRGLLVKQGVDLNRLYTISRGKEDPIAGGHTAADWQTNRRAEFKIYEKR